MDPFVFGMLAGAFVGGGVAAAVATKVSAGAGHDDDAKLNPYAHLLGSEVMVKKYEASPWEHCVVVCASWKGAVKVRRISEFDGETYGNGFWVNKEQAPERVREVDHGAV